MRENRADACFPRQWMHGKQPYWTETLLRCYVQPAAKRLGIAKQIGSHSFRRTFATLLKGIGEDMKTVQELMRHANSRLTLEVYAQALTPAKRAAFEDRGDDSAHHRNASCSFVFPPRKVRVCK